MAITLPSSNMSEKKHKKKDRYKEVLEFYQSINRLLMGREFEQQAAESIAAEYWMILRKLSLKKCTVETLRKCHQEFKYNGPDFSSLEDLAKSAFADLAGQMRNPSVRAVCLQFASMSQTEDRGDLFVHICNVRRFDKFHSHQPVMITLVANSEEALFDLLQRKAQYRAAQTHFSKVNPERMLE